jgi:Tfp pilus tip-associated adhesin PilY1
MEGVQAITTHAVAVTGASSDGLYPNFIKAMATQGGGQYYSASNVTQLTQYLTNIFNAIQAANSVFASASLPVSVNAQGTYKNQVFVGVFRPDGNGQPRWYGNLKQYKFTYDPTTNTLELGDVLGFPALNASTGFFMPTAVSAWTKSSTFWANELKGTPPTASDLPTARWSRRAARRRCCARCTRLRRSGADCTHASRARAEACSAPRRRPSSSIRTRRSPTQCWVSPTARSGRRS